MRRLLVYLLFHTLLIAAPTPYAHLLHATITLQNDRVTLSATIKSSDTGCENYCDWFELLDASGALIYRRILWHSHKNEQPFTRSGTFNRATISPNQTLYLRVHHNLTHYDSGYLVGTLATGFTPSQHQPPFSHYNKNIETMTPQPTECWF